MLKVYENLIRLYPADVRYAYGDEILRDFTEASAKAAQGSRIRHIVFVVRQFVFLLCDIAAERVNNLYSHRSFHGRRKPDPGVVRPPNMGKGEWFRSGDAGSQ